MAEADPAGSNPGGSKLERRTANLADNLRYLRARRDLTQAQLAKRAGIPRTTVANAETGTREYLACEAGTITPHASGERFELQTGDVAVFQGDQPHSYRNHGRTPAVGFSVVTLIGDRRP